MTEIKAHPKNRKQHEAVIALLEALEIDYEELKSTNGANGSNGSSHTYPDADGSYDPEFVKMIQESREEYRHGKTVKVKREELRKYMGLE